MGLFRIIIIKKESPLLVGSGTHLSVIPVPQEVMGKNFKSEPSLGYIMSLRLIWAMWTLLQ